MTATTTPLGPVDPADLPHQPAHPVTTATLDPVTVCALRDLQSRLAEAWAPSTSSRPEAWTELAPQIGQGDVTALLVQERFGGDLLWATVTAHGGDHYVNNIEGVIVDLTAADIFTAPEHSLYRARTQILNYPGVAERYEALLGTVAAGFAAHTDSLNIDVATNDVLNFHNDPISGLDIGVDIDEVMYDFVDSLRRWLILNGHQPHYTRISDKWGFFVDWGLTEAEFAHACHTGVDAGIIFRTGDPAPGTALALTRLLAAGHRIHLVTARAFGEPGKCEESTRAWLAEHGIPYTTLTFSADKTVRHTDLFIDDHVLNYKALVAAGVNAYLHTQDWNINFDVPPEQRVASITEFADRVLALHETR